MRFILFCTFLVILVTLSSSVTHSYSEKTIPDWVKNTAGWWADDQISEQEFVSAIEFLINSQIITVTQTEQNTSQTEKIPDWVKNTAGWWADDQISEQEFVSAIEFLIKIDIIHVDQFLQNVISSLLTWDEIVDDAKFANDGSLKIKKIHFGDSDIMLTTKFDAMTNNFFDVTTFDLLDSGIHLFKITGDQFYLDQANSVANIIQRDLLLESGHVALYSPLSKTYQYSAQNQEILRDLAYLASLNPEYIELTKTLADRIIENEIDGSSNLFYSEFDSEGNHHNDEMYLSYIGSEAIESLLLTYEVTDDRKYLDQAKKTILSYWEQRHPETNLIPSSINASDLSVEKEFMQQYGAGIFLKILLHYYYLTDDPEIFQIMKIYYDAITENFWDGSTWNYRVNYDGVISSKVIEANYAKLDDSLLHLHDLNPQTFSTAYEYAKTNYDNSFQGTLGTANNLVIHGVKDDGSEESVESMMEYAFIINQNVGNRLFQDTNEMMYLVKLNDFYHSVIKHHKKELGYIFGINAYTLGSESNSDWFSSHGYLLNQRASGNISNKINLTFVPLGDVKIIWMKIGEHELTQPFITTFNDSGRFNSIEFDYKKKSILFHTIHNSGQIVFADEIKSVLINNQPYENFKGNVLETIDGTHEYAVFLK